MRIIILGLFGLLLLAPPAFPQTSASASHGGCLVRADLTVLEIIPGACAPKIVKALVEHLDIACTASLQEEAATLSMAAATEQGLSAKAEARLKVLEAVCPSGPPAPPQPPLFLLGTIPLWVRRRCKKLGIDPSLGSRWTENGWLFNSLSEAQGRPRNYPSRGSFYIDRWVEVKTPIEMFNGDREEYLYCDIFDTNGVEEELVTILWDPEQKQYAMETDQGLTWGWIPANSGCYPKAVAFLKEMRRLVNDRKGQGDVGLPQQVRDIQKRSYPLFDMKQWAVRKTFCLKMSCGCLATLIISDPKNGIVINHSRDENGDTSRPQEENMRLGVGRKVRIENGGRILPPDVKKLAHKPCLQLPTQGMEDILDGDWDALEAWIQDDCEWFEEKSQTMN